MDLLNPELLWQESLLTKIKGLIPWSLFQNLDRCGKEEIYKSCINCGETKTHFYRCSNKVCPLCNWRVARARAAVLKEWVKTIQQPKHVVLTRRNFNGILTRKLFRHTMQSFGKIRRTKIFKDMTAGCVSMEVTNERRGWHVHLHILCDARWIDASELAVKWGKYMGQDYAIVKVLDARKKNYCSEVAKYVVKGAELVSWKPEQIAQFILAVRQIRFYATFGKLFHDARRIKAQLECQRPPPEPCKCGCSKFKFETEKSSILSDVRDNKIRKQPRHSIIGANSLRDA